MLEVAGHHSWRLPLATFTALAALPAPASGCHINFVVDRPRLLLPVH